MKVALPRFGESIAPCFEHTATISIYLVVGQQIGERTDFKLTSTNPLDRVRLLKDQRVHTLICGGIEDRYQTMVEGLGIHVICWVSGEIGALLGRFLRGELDSGQTGSDPDSTWGQG